MAPPRIRPTDIAGLFEIGTIPHADERGFFLNAWRGEEWQSCWGERPLHQLNISRTERVGALRGLHTQLGPTPEAKLVRCLRGRVWDVAVDLRPGSASFGHWEAVELSHENANAWLIPEGCLHGFQVLEPGSELLYVHSAPYRPEDQLGVRWDDPQLAIAWPLAPVDLSPRDQQLPLLNQLPDLQS